jgi:hypothetical protein
MHYLGCELVHFNPNAIIALSCFTMLCECWLGITPDTNLFSYNYCPVWYNKVVHPSYLQGMLEGVSSEVDPS